MPSAWSSDVCSRSEEHTSELQSHDNLVCRLLLEKTKTLDTCTDAAADHTGIQTALRRARRRGASLRRAGPRRAGSARWVLARLLLFFFFNGPPPPKFNLFPHPAPLRT